MPIARTCSLTPSCSSSGRLAGSSDSPIWKRGWRSFSISVTWWPRRDSRVATVEPAGPPPITSTSVCCTDASPLDAAASLDPPSIMGWILDLGSADVVRQRCGSAPSRRGCRGQLLFDKGRQRRNTRVIEDFGDIDQPRPPSLDAFMNSDQLQRAGADIEQTLIKLNAAAVELLLADGAQLLRDLTAIGVCRRCLGAQPRQFSQFVAEGAVKVFLFEQMALKLATGGLGDAPYRHHGADLKSRVLADARRNLAGERQKRGHIGAMQYEDQQLVALGACRPHTGDHDLAEFQARHLLSDALQVVRVIVLPIDEQDLLVAAGDVELALMYQSQIAGA